MVYTAVLLIVGYEYEIAAQRCLPGAAARARAGRRRGSVLARALVRIAVIPHLARDGCGAIGSVHPTVSLPRRSLAARAVGDARAAPGRIYAGYDAVSTSIHREAVPTRTERCS